MLELHRRHRTSSAAPNAERELGSRIVAEFREMPGVCLTLAQAARLFSAEPRLCGRVLDALVRSHVLRCERGVYWAAANRYHWD